MHEDKFDIIRSVNNMKNYCDENINNGSCKTCIFYNPFRYHCPFLDGVIPRNFKALINTNRMD